MGAYNRTTITQPLRKELCEHAIEIYFCNACSIFSSVSSRKLSDLIEHYLMRHVGIMESSNNVIGPYCKLCTDVIDYDEVEHHYRTFHNDIGYECPLCCFEAEKQHLIMHHYWRECSISFCPKCKGKCKKQPQ